MLQESLGVQDKAVAVRLQGVAAPEIEHPELNIEEEPGGPRAAMFMTNLVEGRTLMCELTDTRSHGRPIAVCRLHGQNVGAAVIAAGLARDGPRCSKGRYAQLEQPAAKTLPFPAYRASR